MLHGSEAFTGMHYAEAAMAFGALKFPDATGDRGAPDRVLARYRDLPMHNGGTRCQVD